MQHQNKKADVVSEGKISETSREAISEKIEDLKPLLAPLTTTLHYSKQPELEAKYGPQARARCQEEVEQYLDNLAAAVLLDKPEVFSSFIDWSNKVHLSRNVPTAILRDNLECMAEALRQYLPEDMQKVVIAHYLSAGLDVVKS
ncbi:MAG TPA: hypothetical protein VH186_01480 [Chloroflexia bacterium]|nr:hypothetical protein [Chloroflexia bacterium]